MIVDTSAIMSILLDEPDALHFATAIGRASQCHLSAGTWIELAAVITRRKPNLSVPFERFVKTSGVRIAPVTEEQARIGHDAYRRYGRGSGHPANLNFGDCFAYALARATGEPLLFKGDDFVHTDILVP